MGGKRGNGGGEIDGEIGGKKKGEWVRKHKDDILRFPEKYPKFTCNIPPPPLYFPTPGNSSIDPETPHPAPHEQRTRFRGQNFFWGGWIDGAGKGGGSEEKGGAGEWGGGDGDKGGGMEQKKGEGWGWGGKVRKNG